MDELRDDVESTGLSRRTVVAGAAWAVPVIAVAGAAPMAAASVVPPGPTSLTAAQITTGFGSGVAWIQGASSYFVVQTTAGGGETGELNVRFYPPSPIRPSGEVFADYGFRLQGGAELPFTTTPTDVPGHSPWQYVYNQGSNGAWRISLLHPSLNRTGAGTIGPVYVPSIECFVKDGDPISDTNQVSVSKGSSDPVLDAVWSGVTYWPGS